VSGQQQREDRRTWVRVVNDILAMVENGALKPGDHLPSQRVIAADLDCGRETAGRAYRYLAAQHIVRRTQVNGSPESAYVVVADPPPYEYPACPGAGPRPPRKAIALTGLPFGTPGDTRNWVRVANTVLDRIRTGQYTGQLPPRMDLGAGLGVSPATAAKAYRHLAAHGLVVQLPGRGYAVLHAPGAPAAVADDQSGIVLDWLKSRHGDDWEDIRVTWSARCRTGDDQTVTADTAAELDARLQGSLALVRRVPCPAVVTTQEDYALT
jgi:DNA-binding transcriptional regulator YhcF (GntR family)